ncbi:hypothetical protein VNO80_30215 [Phaseolus coccineus]|uniref:Uncharacterized protein n=1 Tax=Phaseolus coccineus TaxID=3886 RepID=A0AAN9LFM2_PHACN
MKLSLNWDTSSSSLPLSILVRCSLVHQLLGPFLTIVVVVTTIATTTTTYHVTIFSMKDMTTKRGGSSHANARQRPRVLDANGDLDVMKRPIKADVDFWWTNKYITPDELLRSC